MQSTSILPPGMGRGKSERFKLQKKTRKNTKPITKASTKRLELLIRQPLTSTGEYRERIKENRQFALQNIREHFKYNVCIVRTFDDPQHPRNCRWLHRFDCDCPLELYDVLVDALLTLKASGEITVLDFVSIQSIRQTMIYAK